MKIQNILIKTEDQKFLVSKISLLIAIFFASLAGYAYFAFIPLFLSSKGFLDGQVIFIMLFMGIGMAVFSWIFGKISDKTGRRKLFFILALLGQVIVLSLLNLSDDLAFFCVLNFFRGLVLGMRMPTSNALFADIMEKSNKKEAIKMNFETIEVSGTQLSLFSATKSGGFAIGVLLSSTLISIFGVDSLVLFLIITTVISLIFALPIRDIKKEGKPEIESDNELTRKDLISEILKSNIDGSKNRSKISFVLYITVFFHILVKNFAYNTLKKATDCIKQKLF